jgi:LAO/AO transport system kinase
VAGGVEHLRSTGALDALRGEQAVAWMWDEVRESLMDRALGTPAARAKADELEAAVARQELSPSQASARLLDGD